MTTLKNSIFFTQDTYFIVMMMQSEALHNGVIFFFEIAFEVSITIEKDFKETKGPIKR